MVPQRACKLKNAPATADTWYLQGCMLQNTWTYLIFTAVSVCAFMIQVQLVWFG